jgi:hypothetical protein
LDGLAFVLVFQPKRSVFNDLKMTNRQGTTRENEKEKTFSFFFRIDLSSFPAFLGGI